MHQTKTRHVSSRRILESPNEVPSKIPLGACEWPKRRHEGFITWAFKRRKVQSGDVGMLATEKVFLRQALLRLPRYLCPNILQWCDDFVLGFCGHHDGIKFAVGCHLSPSDKENVSTRIHCKAFHWNFCNAQRFHRKWSVRSIWDDCILHRKHPPEIPAQPGAWQSWNWIFKAKPSTLGAPISITFWKPPASLVTLCHQCNPSRKRRKITVDIKGPTIQLCNLQCSRHKHPTNFQALQVLHRSRLRLFVFTFVRAIHGKAPEAIHWKYSICYLKPREVSWSCFTWLVSKNVWLSRLFTPFRFYSVTQWGTNIKKIHWAGIQIKLDVQNTAKYATRFAQVFGRKQTQKIVSLHIWCSVILSHPKTGWQRRQRLGWIEIVNGFQSNLMKAAMSPRQT